MTPSEALALKEESRENPFVYGYAPGEPSAKDYTTPLLLVPRAAPTSYLSPGFQKTPIYSQQGGTCVGNSIAAAFTHLQYQETGEVFGFNGEELNARVTHREGESCSFKPVMDDVLKSGVRYHKGTSDGLFFPRAYANVDYRDVEAMKAAIATPGQMVVFATWLPEGWDSTPKEFRPAAPGPEGQGGLHAMLAVGYQEGLIVQNEWDRWFGDEGYVRFGWDYVVKHFVEAMAITDQSDIAGGYVKTYEFPDPTWERAIKRPDKPAVYLVKENGRIWIKDIWEAKRFGVNLAAVERVPATDKVWALPVIGPDAPRKDR